MSPSAVFSAGEDTGGTIWVSWNVRIAYARGMGYEAVLFDLDGTLLDTLGDIAGSANRALAACGLPTHPVDAYRLMVGEGVRKLIERSLPADRRDEPTMAAVMEAYRQDYSRNWAVTTRPYAGIADMLDALASRGLKLAVLSNKPDEFTRLCVAQLLPQWRFDMVLGASARYPHKPDPAAAIAIAQQLNIAPARFVYLGDSAVDMRTARAAGMYAVGALWGFRGRAELEAAGADCVIERPMELMGRLDIEH